MGFLDFFRQPDINQGVKDCQATPGGLLLDVRTPQEYRQGRIPGSRNLPLQELGRVEAVAASEQTPLFVYCHSGARSGQAVRMLQRMGYTDVRNIGGIVAYTGQLER